MVIIDTSIWVPALKRGDSREREVVTVLIEEGQAAITGIVLVEVLRGARNQGNYDNLLQDLYGVEFLDTHGTVWHLAAQILLRLKLQGEVIPLADAVIAAQALEGGHSIYSADEHFRRVEGLSLYQPA